MEPIFRKGDQMESNRHQNNSFLDKARDTTRPTQRHHTRTNCLRVPLRKERPILYPYHNGCDCGTPTVDLLTVKLMFNSIISTPNAKFMTIDIKDFYLMTPMDRFEYFRMKLELFPDKISSRSMDLKIKWTQMATFSVK